MKRWLIPEWRRAHRMFSVQVSALLGVLSFLQVQILPLYQFAVPAQYWPWVTAGFATAIIVVRLVHQSSVAGPAEPPTDAPPTPASGATP